MLFLPGLRPSVEQFRDIGALFGELEVHPYIPKVDESVPEVVELDSEVSPKADLWHTDVTFSESPPIAALLHMVDGPAFGGDTMWINTLDVYDTLSEPLKAMLDGLTCTHDDARGTLSAEHPVVRVQPGHRSEGALRQQAVQSPDPAAVAAGVPDAAGSSLPLAGAGQVQLPLALVDRRCRHLGRALHAALRRRRHEGAAPAAPGHGAGRR